jgi:hypothetical protein
MRTSVFPGLKHRRSSARNLSGQPSDTGASALVCSVVADGRRMVEEIQVRTFLFPQLWSRGYHDDEEGTEVELRPLCGADAE